MIVGKLRKSISNLYRVENIIENKLQISLLKESALNSNKLGVSNNRQIDKPIVVSLTTYGKKIFDVYLVIESIFQQTFKPDRVVLWISEEHFSLNSLPFSLKCQINRGLEVRFCKDIRSYTKLVYSLKEFSGCHIVSVDDDIIYPFDMIENFVNAYSNDSRKVYFNKGHNMLYDHKKKKMKPYIEWCKAGYVKGSSIYYLPLGVYGIFYPDGILHNDVVKDEIFLDISPMADDIWFKAMSLVNNVECQAVMPGAMNSNSFISIELDREKALARTNVDQGANDWQIKFVFDRYKLFDYFNV